jgi:hypothetical protein
MADPFSLEDPFPFALTDGLGSGFRTYLGRPRDSLNASFARVHANPEPASRNPPHVAPFLAA